MFSLYLCVKSFLFCAAWSSGDPSHQDYESFITELIFLVYFLSRGYRLEDRFIFRDSSYVTIPLSNYPHPVPAILKHGDVPSQGQLLINWSSGLTLCYIIAALQSAINHFILFFLILWPFGILCLKWAKHCGGRYRVIFQQIQQMALKWQRAYCAEKQPSGHHGWDEDAVGSEYQCGNRSRVCRQRSCFLSKSEMRVCWYNIQNHLNQP